MLPKDLPVLTDSHVMDVCLPGKGAETCRYLAMSAKGWSCEKHSELAAYINKRVEAGTMNALGDNCEGRR